MNEWERELEVDAAAVRCVAAPHASWRLLASGWDCDAWLADEAVVWRVPRRAVGIAALEHEAQWMPRLAPHLAAMAANLKAALRPAAEPMGEGIHVSVKPKRGEGMGAIGRSEGIAVWAVALLDRG